MKYKIIFPLLFIVITRIPFIFNSPLEYGEYWRQCDTESIAVNFVEDRFHILYPQFNYDGEKPNYVQLELQLLTYITAIFYSLFGRRFVIPRIIALAFFVGSAGYLYAIIKRYSGDIAKNRVNEKDIHKENDHQHIAATIGTLIYASYPTCIFISRAIMPEPLLMFFMLSAFYYFLLWYDGMGNKYLYLSGILTALAIASKTVAIFIGLAMLILCIKKYGKIFIVQKELWLFASLSLIPYILFFIITTQTAEFPIVYKLCFHRMISSDLFQIFKPDQLINLGKSIATAMTPVGLLVFFLCLINLRKMPIQLSSFVIALLVECVIIVSIIKFPYYVVPLSAAAAMTIGYSLRNKNKYFVYLLCILFFAVNQYNCFPLYSTSKTAWIGEAVKIIEENTQKNDLIVINTFDPSILSFGRRCGWRANIKYYDNIPKEIDKEVAYFKDNGAKFFYVYNQSIYDDEDKSYISYLNQHFEKTDFGEGHVLYHLDIFY